MMSLLFVYVVFSTILHVLILHNNCCLFAAVIAIDVFLKSFYR